MDHIAPRLDVRDLQLVLALAATGSTARAVEMLHLTQPAISRALLAAESKLGVRLFERVPRGLLLTDAGRRLADGAPHVLASLQRLERALQVDSATPTQLRIVCECYTAYRWIPSALQRLQSTMPGVALSLSVEHTEDPVRGLERGQIDVALLTTARFRDPELEERALLTDEIVFVLAASHPLARKAALTASDLREATLLTSRVPAEEQAWFLQKVFGRARPRLRFERLPLTEAILDVARAGLGVAVLSEWIVGPYLGKGDLVVKRLARGKLARPWRIAFRKEVRESALRLRTALRATAPRLANH